MAQALQLSRDRVIPSTRARLDQVYAPSRGQPVLRRGASWRCPADAVPAIVCDLLEAPPTRRPSHRRVVLRRACRGATGRAPPPGPVVDLDDQALDDALRPTTSGTCWSSRACACSATPCRTRPYAALMPGRTVPPAPAACRGPDRRATLADSRHARRPDRPPPSAADEAPGGGPHARPPSRPRRRSPSTRRSPYEWVVALPGVTATTCRGPAAPAALGRRGRPPGRRRRPRRRSRSRTSAFFRVDPEQRHHHAYLHIERLGRYLWMAADGERAAEAYRQRRGRAGADRTGHQLAGRDRQRLPQNPAPTSRLRRGARKSRRAGDHGYQVPGRAAIEGHACATTSACHWRTWARKLDGGIDELETAARIAREEFDDVDDIARALVNLHSVLFESPAASRRARGRARGDRDRRPAGPYRKRIWCRCDGRRPAGARLFDEAEALAGGAFDRTRRGSTPSARTACALALHRGWPDEARRELDRSLTRGRHKLVDGDQAACRGEPRPCRDAALQGDRAAAVSFAEVRAWEWSSRARPPSSRRGHRSRRDGAVAARAARRAGDERRWTRLTEEFVAAAAENASAAPTCCLCLAALVCASSSTLRAGRRPGLQDAAAGLAAAGDAHQRLRPYADGGAVAVTGGGGASSPAVADWPGAATLQHVALLRLPRRPAGKPSLLADEHARRPSAQARGRPRFAPARGRTDRQIGAELNTSHRTARHVAGAYLPSSTPSTAPGSWTWSTTIIPPPRRGAGRYRRWAAGPRPCGGLAGRPDDGLLRLRGGRALLLDRGRDGGLRLDDPLDDLLDAAQRGAGGLDVAPDRIDDPADPLGRLGRLPGEVLDLTGDDGEALARLPRPRRLDGRVQRQQVGLVGDRRRCCRRSDRSRSSVAARRSTVAALSRDPALASFAVVVAWLAPRRRSPDRLAQAGHDIRGRADVLVEPLTGVDEFGQLLREDGRALLPLARAAAASAARARSAASSACACAWATACSSACCCSARRPRSASSVNFQP